MNNHIFKFYSPLDSHTILVFYTKHGNILTGPPNWGKITIFDQYLALGLMTVVCLSVLCLDVVG